MVCKIVYLASLILASAIDINGNDLTEAEKAEILADHNKFRSITALGNTDRQPAVADMIKLEWDEELAQSSKKHAEKCVWKHSAADGSYGENLAAAASTADNLGFLTLKNGIENWYAEHTDYTYESRSCDAVCGHYTQMVWAKTTRIGCAWQLCGPGLINQNYPFQSILVCQYAPAGNWNGQFPYKKAAADSDIASACPTGYFSNKLTGLCEKNTNPTTDPIQSPNEVVPVPCTKKELEKKTLILDKGKEKKVKCKYIIRGDKMTQINLCQSGTGEKSPEFRCTCICSKF
uniref:SCP domain-containing protein n=1 Tax=Corethron hystrix TaxID=216773 RepID=A0A7S1BGG5_9STRA|mmetsp:Transcript_26697/g.61435  ORF Transcript_26697/g.61435 Transcript_26697/m.61435 type:complete len:290 (+) Transcript_26697:190-1059(+)